MSCARPCALESVALHQNDASKNHAPYLPLEDVIEWTSFFFNNSPPGNSAGDLFGMVK